MSHRILPRSLYRRFFKRVIDLLLSIAVLLMVWPLLITIYLALWVAIGRPVMLHQRRPGFKEKPFTICKFRTMTNERDPAGNLLPDEQRITAIGRFLRRYSLDEVSEVINILKGEMSFVGPRPLMMQYLDRYSPEQHRRHDVMPGLTGWVQVNGRNGLTWEEKFSLDIWYVDHQSFSLDFQILVKTLLTVIRHEGISQEGYVAAEEFMGSNAVRHG
ncbi:MAG TPA: sugar transferase [Bacteroidota bacterium]|nr:sugar transferase [Bacteroidota bacterium]